MAKAKPRYGRSGVRLASSSGIAKGRRKADRSRSDESAATPPLLN
jgi:hypothetical protein